MKDWRRINQTCTGFFHITVVGRRRAGARNTTRALAHLLLVLASSAELAQQGDGTDVQTGVHTFKPDKVEATPSRLQALNVPNGVLVRPLAQGVQNARIVTLSGGLLVRETRMPREENLFA